MIAQQLCLDHPDLQGELVKGIVLVNSTYGPAIETLIGGAAMARFERTTRKPFDALGKQSHHIDRVRSMLRPSDLMFWGVAFGAFGPHASAAHIDLTFDMLADTSSDIIFELIKSYRDFDARERLDEIVVPALIIGGQHDRLTLPAASEFLAQHLPKSELHILEGVGHMSMLERHDDVNQLLTNFLDDTLGEAGTDMRGTS
jgi:pimeloyl-ACP methyl ester carboxylesterase